MSRTSLLTFLLVTVQLSLGTACVTALPPVAANPTELRAADAGEAAVDVGGSAFYDRAADQKIEPNAFGGDINGRLEYGVNDRVQVSGSVARTYLGPSYTLSSGYTLEDSPRGKLGLTLGVTSGAYSGEKTTTTPVLDDNGQPVTDQNGNPTYTEETTPYRYLSVAPAVGIRGDHLLRDKVELVYHARAAFARTFNLEGLDASDVEKELWVDASAGVVGRPSEHLSMGASLGLLASPTLSGFVTPTLGVSARYEFGGKK